ncbi:MAG: FAA hydrolase family protein [Sphingobacteriales bacterium]|nr:MAG: FAA hydrolase family protein [Sphingobacteriales bacterium]
MKIICIGRNYGAHAKELGNEVPDEPVIFLKPDTALLKDNKPFYLPDWSNDIHYEAELVYKVCRNGKYISEAHAYKYVEEITLGIDFTARDIQTKLKNKGLPWELAKGFDGSAVIGKFSKISELENKDEIAFSLDKNGETVQKATSAEMIFSLSKLIAFVSRYISLKQGDLIFTGTPQGVGPVKIGDELRGFIEDREVFAFKIK